MCKEEYFLLLIQAIEKASYPGQRALIEVSDNPDEQCFGHLNNHREESAEIVTRLALDYVVETILFSWIINCMTNICSLFFLTNYFLSLSLFYLALSFLIKFLSVTKKIGPS